MGLDSNPIADHVKKKRKKSAEYRLNKKVKKDPKENVALPSLLQTFKNEYNLGFNGEYFDHYDPNIEYVLRLNQAGRSLRRKY